MRLKYKSFLFLHLCFFYVVLLFLFVFLRCKSSKSKRRNKTNYYPSNIGNKKNMIFIMLHSSCYVCKRTSYFKEQKTHILWNATKKIKTRFYVTLSQISNHPPSTLHSHTYTHTLAPKTTRSWALHNDRRVYRMRAKPDFRVRTH